MKTTKRLWVLTLALALILTLIPAVSAAGEYTAEFAAQFNPDVNGDVGEWPDLSGVSIAFDLGAESTLTVEFDAPVAFGGNYAAINTDVPFPGHTGEIVSFTLDGVEVEMGAAYINGEGIGGGLRLALCNKWNSDIEEQPVDVETLGEFTVLEVVFRVYEGDGGPGEGGGAALDPDADYNAEFGAQFNPDVNGDLGEWPDLSAANITFKAGAEATLTVEFDAPAAFGGNYAAINTDVPYPGSAGEIRSFTLDGVEVDMGAAYINGEGIGGGLRLTLCNKWNSDIEEQPVDVETLGEFSVLEITFIVFSSDEPPPPPPPAPETPAFDPNGEYTAYLGIQGSNWIFRNAWADASFGENGSVWADYDGNHFFSLFETEDGSVHPGTFTDVTLKGNGTYRASLTGADFSGSIANGAADAFNLLFLSTNIPIAGEPLEFSDVRVIIGGSTRHTFRDMDTIVIEGADKGYYEIHCINRWNGELGGEDGLFGYVVPTGGEEIAIEFTVSGFAYDNEDAEPPAPTLAPPPPTEPPAPAEDGGGLRVWLLALILLGAAAGAAAIAVAVVVLVKKSKKKQ